jgi:hypothetical protein
MSNKRLIRTLVASVVLAAAVCRPVLAYIDPGTGMSFVSGIGAFIAGFFAIAFGAIVVTFKRWTAYLKSFFKKKDGGNHPR